MYPLNRNLTRLDAGESAMFLRQLEDIDSRAFMRRYPDLIARQVIPTFENVAQWAAVYTYREWTPNGAAKFIKDLADDLPSVDVTGKEFSQSIRDCGNSYKFSIKEIKYAAANGLSLDGMRAEAARTATEQLLDQTLATGSALEGLQGILSLDSTAIASANRVTVVTASTKAAGGVAWGTLLAPVATGQEVANDVIGLASKIVSDTKGIWSRLNVVLPIDQYNYMAATRLNAINDTTALEFVLKNANVASVRPWYACATAGGSSASRLAMFPSDPMVLGGIVPMEWTPQAPQQRNLSWVINCLASCGGVVCRYPIAMRYMDAI